MTVFTAVLNNIFANNGGQNLMFKKSFHIFLLIIISVFILTATAKAKVYQLLVQGGNPLIQGTLRTTGLDWQDPNGQIYSSFNTDVDGAKFANVFFGTLSDQSNDTITCYDTTAHIAYDATGDDIVSVYRLRLVNDDSGSTVYGNYITLEDDATAGIAAAIRISNLQSTSINITDGIKIDASTDGTITDAIDVSDAEITNAINVGANAIVGTTAILNFTNFDVDASGNITVLPGYGIDVNTAGELKIGDSTATTIGLGGTSATTINIGNTGALDRTFNIGCGASEDVINIGTGGTVADDINIGDSLAVVDIVGATANITGTTGTINYTNFDVDSVGNLEVSGIIHTDLYEWKEEFDDELAGVQFESGLVADFWESSGDYYTATDIVYTNIAGGGITMSPDGTDDSTNTIFGLPNWRVDNDPIFETRFKITDVSNCCVMIGFSEDVFYNRADVTEDMVAVYIDYDAADTTPDTSIFLWTSDNNVDVTDDLGVDATDDTFIIFKVDLTDTEQPRVWINGSEISSGLITGTVQAGVTLRPFALVQDKATEEEILTLDYMRSWQTR